MYRRTLDGKEMIIVCNYEKASEIPLPQNVTRILGNYPEHADNTFAPYEAAIYMIK